MVLEFDENIFDNFPQPSQYSKQLQTLQSQLPAVLADFQKYYVFYNKNPEYQEYGQMFENIKDNLNEINMNIFSLSNDIQMNTDKINEKFFVLNKLIKKEKVQNRKLKIKLGIVENKNNASIELISDYKQMYESGYLRNWGLFLSIIIAAISIKKLY